MLDFLIQGAATFGPVALTIMGVWVSIRPPSPSGRAHLIWAASFAIVGIITATALFRELRGTDALLDRIWDKIGVESGPRLEFAGIKQDNSTGDLTMQFSNTKDIDAVGYFIAGAILTEDDIEKAFSIRRKAILEHTALLRGTTPISRGMGVGLPSLKLSKSDIDSIADGKIPAYMLATAIYIGEDTPENKLWVTEICAKIIKPFTDFQPCQTHNGYFYSDKKLTGVP